MAWSMQPAGLCLRKEELPGMGVPALGPLCRAMQHLLHGGRCASESSVRHSCFKNQALSILKCFLLSLSFILLMEDIFHFKNAQ